MEIHFGECYCRYYKKNIIMSVRNIQKKLNIIETGLFDKETSISAMKFLNLTSIQAAHFLGQCDHETGGWRLFVENLNYSAQGLANTWPMRFSVNPKQKPLVPNELANKIQRNPEAIANNTYANRIGNGNIESGDGWRFIGRGAIQLTGRSNYTDFSRIINEPKILINPELVATEYILESAKWFFDKNKLWSMCTDVTNQTIERITRRVNGGTHGLQDRINQTNKYINWLK
jgi:putative chitinase